eukprot:CAMPEP_0173217808 /NCGR_PEP_ID=MMETSP1142-20121109/706_1 /TAXON_ID=483371 /ORGANISM="non described non described, Strain CCMP2298" /LENGTH=73 /DNA_ID=CAMNT_0014145439 /DNA_START=375 /DNA_END=593 /DNA_ORIENTATION=-
MYNNSLSVSGTPSVNSGKSKRLASAETAAQALSLSYIRGVMSPSTRMGSDGAEASDSSLPLLLVGVVGGVAIS